MSFCDQFTLVTADRTIGSAPYSRLQLSRFGVRPWLGRLLKSYHVVDRLATHEADALESVETVLAWLRAGCLISSEPNISASASHVKRLC